MKKLSTWLTVSALGLRKCFTSKTTEAGTTTVKKPVSTKPVQDSLRTPTKVVYTPRCSASPQGQNKGVKAIHAFVFLFLVLPSVAHTEVPAELLDNGDPVPVFEIIAFPEIPAPTPTGVDRSIPIYKGSAGTSSAESAKFLYMHKPIFALIPKTPSTNELAHKVEKKKTGEKWRLKFLISNENIRKYLGDILKLDSNVTTLPNVNLGLVSVRPFKVLDASFRCYARMDNTLTLASGDFTAEGSDERDAILDVLHPTEFRKAIKESEARCLIKYSFQRRHVQVATTVATLASGVESEINDLTNAGRLKGNVGFSTTKQAIRQKMTSTMELTTISNDPSLIPNTKDFDKLIEEFLKATSFDFNKPIDTYKEAVESYLKAELQKVVNEQTQTDKSVATSELNINVGANVEVFKLTADQKDRFERTHEMKFHISLTNDKVVPGSIKLYVLQDNWRQILAQGVRSVVVSRVAGAGSDSEEINLSLTQEMAERAIGSAKVADTATGLVPGMAFCYFGAGELPKGWIELNGPHADGTKKFWPRDSWVPRHLQGELMVDMRNTTALGVATEIETGRSKLDTAFKFPDYPLFYTVPMLGASRHPVSYVQRGGDYPGGVEPAHPDPTTPHAGLNEGGLFNTWVLMMTDPHKLQGVVFDVHRWTPFTALTDGATSQNLNLAPSITWNNENRPPYTTCRWVMRGG